MLLPFQDYSQEVILYTSYRISRYYNNRLFSKANMAPANSVTVISSSYHLGIRDVAVGGGPIELLKAGFVDAIRKQGVTVHQIELNPVDELDGDISRVFELLRRTSKTVAQVVQEGSFPIIMAGNCSTTVGVQAGITTALGSVPACIWFNAHDDFNTPDALTSGYFDSMGVAMMAGLCWKNLLGGIPGFKALDLTRDLIHCGMRDVTDLERSRVWEAGFTVIWGNQDKHVHFEMELSEALTEKKLGETMVHLDLDALDISVGEVNKFSAAGGLLEEDLVKCLKMVPSKTEPVSLTVASFDPSFDERGKIPPVAIKGVVSFVGSLIDQGVLKSERTNYMCYDGFRCLFKDRRIRGYDWHISLLW